MRVGDSERKKRITECVEKYSDTIYRVALSSTKSPSDAEDIVQEVFLRYIRRNPDFINDEHAKAWFIRVTLNCSRNLLKSAWFKKTESIKEEYPAKEKDSYEIRSEVMKLPKKYRIVIHLYYYEEYSIKEIADIINKKENTIKTNLRRAKILLKERLNGDYNEF